MTNPFEEITTRLTRIENLLLEKESRKPDPVLPVTDKLLNITQASQLINMTKGSLYGLVHKGKVPYSKPGKLLYFSEKELREWVQSGRRQTSQEIQAEALKSLKRIIVK